MLYTGGELYSKTVFLKVSMKTIQPKKNSAKQSFECNVFLVPEENENGIRPC